jgi:hypothetical protein
MSKLQATFESLGFRIVSFRVYWLRFGGLARVRFRVGV